jgi:tRNA(Ile)-lysidine synthase
MARLGPFEVRPHLAVAVSGGPDSMALCLLAHDWARSLSGRVTALTVDHRLRPASADEAARTGTWLEARGIRHAILPWSGAKPATGIQAAAREARYRLLAAWCRANGALHLLLAHHLDDQAETCAMRAERGSGADGLAGMAAVREIEGLRLLRPLLSVPRARLRRTLEALGQAWIEDPSNRDPGFRRAALRLYATNDLPDGDEIQRRGADRLVRDGEIAALAARYVRIHPAGFAIIDRAALDAGSRDAGLILLQRCIVTIGGLSYPPRSARLARLHIALNESTGHWTLGSCLVLGRADHVLVTREPAACAPPQTIEPGETVLWDGRFTVAYRRGPGALTLRPLGPGGWKRLRSLDDRFRPPHVPATALRTLPALFLDEKPATAAGFRPSADAGEILSEFRFAPRMPLAGAPFGTMTLSHRPVRLS